MIGYPNLYYNAINLLGDYSFSCVGTLTKYEDIDWTYPDQIASKEDVEAKYQEVLNKEPIRLLREERDRRLAKTDWTQSRDVTLENDTEWKIYRQALRDLPATADPQLDDAGNLTNITWPEVPK
tara:strand:- start:638 stop:1009 length:372 start_codon:yes stop_codon:yes gene_type:complete